jgi:RNA-directed DNA polymerase
MAKGDSRLAATKDAGRSPVNTGAPQAGPHLATARVLTIQRKLHQWASQDREKRFDDLFNLIVDPATLRVAWERVKANKGSRTAGVDAVTRYQIEQHHGVERMLNQLREELRAGTFRPQPVRERAIPKANGKSRYLGIPTLRDRVVQMAMKHVLEPIFEADFYASSYGYRPGRRAQDAVAEVVHFANPPSGYEWVIEADIEACFDRIRHGTIMTEVARRVGDRKVLALVRSFLRAGVMTQMGQLERRLTGTPQGGIISPLLANIALTVLDREFERRWDEMSRYPGHRQYLRRKGLPTYRLIRFADDFVVVVKGTREQAEAILQELPAILNPIGLKLSAEKTRLTHIDNGFCFLGLRIQRRPRRGKVPCVYTFVSDEALTSVKRKLKALTKASNKNLALHQLLRAINPILRGWAAYFRFAAAKRTLSYLGHYAWWRVVRWLRKKHAKSTWRWTWQRYGLAGQPREAGVALHDPRTIAVLRYRYRGAQISTPWNGVDSIAPGHRRMAFDETEKLGAIQESLNL